MTRTSSPTMPWMACYKPLVLFTASYLSIG